jgi:iron complex transport system permease protein
VQTVGKKPNSMRPIFIMVLLFFMIIAAFLVSMNLGMIQLAPVDVLKTLLGDGTEKQKLILYDFRLPRIVIAVLVGMGLAVSGAIMQGISRNGLADPGILGINAGAGLAVVAVIYFTSGNPQSVNAAVLPFAALLGALLAAVLVYVFAWKKGITPKRLLLVGIAVGSGISAIMSLFMLKMRFYTHMLATIWLSGSLWGTNWQFVLAFLPWILILLPFAIYKARYLNVLNLGDAVATGLGAAVERQRIILIVTAVALAGSCVAVGGGIGFLGLLGPHIARKLVGPNHKMMIPTAALAGGLLLLIADTIGKNVLAPYEIPVGIVVSGIGAPYFLYLLIKSKNI